jgi:hypothetical protein
MVRSKVLALSFACALSMPATQAGFTEDIAKLTAGAAAGYGIGYGIDAWLTSSSGHPQNPLFIPMATLAGIAVSLPFTSYVRYMRAQWNLRYVNNQLMNIVKNNQNNPAELIKAIDTHYVKSHYSLLNAFDDLCDNDAYLAAAEDLFKLVENSFLNNAKCTAYIKTTLLEIAQLRALIAPALVAIKQDPRCIAMFAAREAAIAAAHAALAAARQEQYARKAAQAASEQAHYARLAAERHA